MGDLTWEDVKEWKTKQYDCDDGRLIQFDADCINWLMQEVKRLKPFEHEYICKKCGIRQNSCQEPPTF